MDLVDSNLRLEDCAQQLRVENLSLKNQVDALEKKSQQLGTELSNLKDRLTLLGSKESRRRISAQVHSANDSWIPNVVEKNIYDVAVEAISSLIQQIAQPEA